MTSDDQLRTIPGNLSAANLKDVIEQRCAQQPQKLALNFLRDGELANQEPLHYGELDRRARAILAALRTCCAKGDRVLLLFPSGNAFLCSFVACMYGGIVAVPAAMPGGRAQDWARVSAILGDSQAKAILSYGALADRVERSLKGHGWSGRVIDVAKVNDADAAGVSTSEIAGDDLAFLQYTSGSTGNPKGVMVSHANLFHNQKIIHAAMETDADTRMVSWLPMFHDMGLIGTGLHPLYLGVELHYMAPGAFLQRPLRWLEAVSHFRGTLSGAPNFAYELCIARYEADACKALDLSSWHRAFNGAEPVRPITLQRFYETYAPHGLRATALYPTYGLAEAVLQVTGAPGARPPALRHVNADSFARGFVAPAEPGEREMPPLVGVGRVVGGQRLQIVNPGTLALAALGEIGEIWLSGPSVAKGYWRNEDATRETFRARVGGSSDEREYLRTGDLGYVDENGELYITGRIKDTIIISGKNYFPQDLEYAVETVSEAFRAGCGAIFSVESEGEEKIVVIQEVRVSDPSEVDANALIKAVRAKVATEFQLNVFDVCLLKPRTLFKTTSGKVQRQRNKQAYLAGELSLVARHRDAERTRTEALPVQAAATTPGAQAIFQMIGAWLRTLPGAPATLAKDDLFVDTGMNSAQAVALSEHLSTQLGRRVDASLIWDHPEIFQFCQVLSERLKGETGATEAPDKPRAGTNAHEVAERERQARQHAEPRLSAELASATTPAEDALRTLFAHLKNLEAENARLKRGTSDEPIAIVGIGCRLPCGVGSASEFGQRLAANADWPTRLPDERPVFPIEAKPHWKTALIDDVEHFDAAFFDLNETEAEEIDPQQRMLLQVTYHALEDARYPGHKLRGRDVGVFVGVSSDDYQSQTITARPDRPIHPYSVLGTSRAIAAGRIAFHFDFHGPVATVDTACSSSSLAIHLACNSLREGDASVALAGGVCVNLNAEGYAGRDSVKKLSASGKTRPFSADADGFTRGEGCGILVLKRLSDAVADGDRVHAVIYASSVNHNGRSNGMTAPNGEAHRKLLRRALERSGLRADEIDFVEPSAVGSSLGDSIEAHAVGDVLASRRDKPLWLGSTKGRLGHLEAASGVTSVIKTCEMLARDTLFADEPIERPSTLVDWRRYPLRLLDKPVSWPRKPGIARHAVVNAFAVSGTNVAILLGDAPELRESTQTVAPALPAILLVSGRTPGAYLANVRAFAQAVGSERELHALALGSCLYKDHFRYRKSFLASDRDSCLEALRSAEAEVPEARRNDELAFYFGGDSWTLASVRELYARVGPFKTQLDELLSACAKEVVDLSWLDTPQGQRCLTALSRLAECALARTWLALGVRPAVLAARGDGVFAAACLAGFVSPAQLGGLEPAREPLFATSESAAFGVLVATSEGGFAPLEARTFQQIEAAANTSRSAPVAPTSPSHEVLHIGSGLGSETTGEVAGAPVDHFMTAVRRLYELGFDLRFDLLYTLRRTDLNASLPHYQFDNRALWSNRIPKRAQVEESAQARVSTSAQERREASGPIDA